MLRTKSGLPKHCCWNTDQRGNRYVRFRKNGVTTNLTGIPWSEGFMRQYATALEGVNSKANIGAERTRPGSFNALVVSYYRSPEFLGLKASTQTARRGVLERFRNEHGDKPVNRLSRAHIKNIIGAKANTPEAANTLLKVLRLILNYAVSIDMIAANPAIGIKQYRSKNPDGIHTFTEEELTQFIARHPVGTMPHLATMLMLCLGQRRSDVIRMGWQHVRNGKTGKTIALRQEKTKTALTIPIHPDLEQALAAAPRDNLTFIVGKFGKPFTPIGFSNWYRDRCDEAGLPQCSAHGLRKLAATRLAEVGCSEREIMAITGHRSVSEVSRYTKAAEQSRLAERAIAKLTSAVAATRTEQDEKLSSAPDPLDKTTSN
jgi:integrase